MIQTNHRNRRRATAGFTLLEMMLVVAIIGILMSVAIFAVGGQGKKARDKATLAKMKQVETMLGSYKLDKGVYPQNLQVLIDQKYVTDITDAWQHPFNYVVPGPAGRDYILTSSGEDGTPGTEDDLDPVRIAEQERQAANGGGAN